MSHDTDPTSIKSQAERQAYFDLANNFLEKVQAKDLSEIPLIDDLEFTLKRCDKHFELFSVAHVQLISTITDTSAEAKFQEFDTMESKLQVVTVALKHQIALKKVADSNSDPQAHELPTPRPNQNEKLTKIEIPKFDGDFAKWPEFRDLFRSLIHDHKNVPDVQKMQYLKMNLSGTAAGVIKHLQVNGSHYEPAWTALNKRYNNKKALVTSNIKRLLIQKYVQTEKADELRGLLDTTKEILYYLSNPGEPTEHWNSIAVFIVSHSLPAETTALWENQIAKNDII